MLTASGDLTL